MSKTEGKNRGNAQKYQNILGIDILSTSPAQLLNSLEKKIEKKEKFSIFTPNPEIVLASTKDGLLKEALGSSDFLVPDGVGLAYASKFLYGHGLNVIPGRKLFLSLIDLANEKGWKVFLFGGWGNVVELAARKLQITHYKLQIKYAAGPRLNNDGTPTSEDDKKLMVEAINKINTFKPDLLFVAFGHPKQEIWINKNLSKLNVGGAMAIGGTLRYTAGVVPLPPKWMEEWGLEWLFRLGTEPRRLGRIINAAIVFPWKVFWSKFKS